MHFLHAPGAHTQTHRHTDSHTRNDAVRNIALLIAPTLFCVVSGLTEKKLTCHCDGLCPVDQDTCQPRAGGKCFSMIGEYVDEVSGLLEQERIFGCMSPDDNGGMFQVSLCEIVWNDLAYADHALSLPSHLQCKSNPDSSKNNIICCDNEDFCNRNLRPVLQTDTTTPSSAVSPLSIGDGAAAVPLFALLTSIIVCSGIFIIIIGALYVIYRRRERTHSGAKHAAASPRACLIDTMMRGGSAGGSIAHNASHLADLVELSSGSGSGLPLLVQRTIVKEIEFTQQIGQGRYGKVYLAKFRGENVAAKVFHPAAEASWFREAEIYQSVMMRHENIMGFIAADIDGSGQRMLITHYHELGSLHDYLQAHVLTPAKLFELAHSLAAGLAHLHTEIFGSSGKPAIAHGDINSKNVLVKKDGRCAIADFGLAVKYLSDLDDIQVAKNPRGPSVRYMAPECLSRQLVSDKFESYKAADMYAAGLVLWEMARCCATPAKGTTKKTVCEDYALPYHDVVPTAAMSLEPRVEDMARVVVAGGVRPPLAARWEDDEVLRQVRGIMVDCWKENPAARLTALRVKKTLSKLLLVTSVQTVTTTVVGGADPFGKQQLDQSIRMV